MIVKDNSQIFETIYIFELTNYKTTVGNQLHPRGVGSWRGYPLRRGMGLGGGSAPSPENFTFFIGTYWCIQEHIFKVQTMFRSIWAIKAKQLAKVCY